jgi:rRNA processing protein Krr1/Pno1
MYFVDGPGGRTRQQLETLGNLQIVLKKETGLMSLSGQPEGIRKVENEIKKMLSVSFCGGSN